MSTAIQLALRNHEVTLATTVREAKGQIASHTFDAWLLDVRVPDGSGMDVLSWARADGHRTPALVMTGEGERDTPNLAQALGAEFLFKPYSKRNLEAFLERAVEDRARISAKAARCASERKLPRREADVLLALARGVSRAALAAELGVKENTVKSIVRKLLRHTGHTSVADLLRGLLRAP